MFGRLVIFLWINFLGLFFGTLFTTPGVNSKWHIELEKAPWTPPGWVFSVVWCLIMLAMTIYMMQLWDRVKNRTLLVILFSVQWLLNFLWNPIFFHFHEVALGMIDISLLTIVVTIMMLYYRKEMKMGSLLLLPYVLWLLVAASLNGYILLYN